MGSPVQRDAVRRAESLVHVIDEDPDLGAMLSDDRLELARTEVVAREVRLPTGPWTFTPEPRPGDLGLLTLEGFLLITVGIPGREHVEVMGPGDLVSPWIVDEGVLSAPLVVSTTVVSPVRLAHLDRHFALQIARAPEVHAALIHRLIMRARRLSLQAAVNGIPRITERLEVTLRHLAERYGHVTPDGIRLELPLTHSQLAGIAGAQRPSVTSGLTRLRSTGRVERRADGSWLLRGDRPAGLEELARQVGLEP